MSRAEDIFEKIKKDGEKAIDVFILTQQSEELFLDFKRSANEGNGTVLADIDRNNLAKAISGFGNSEGRVIVWGIECKKQISGADLPEAKFPIINVKRFISFLENAISGCTIPPHSGVKNHAVVTKNGDGLAITYIPKSDSTPHQDVQNKHYYIRAGSNFVPISHDVLAGLFGKRPQPNVYNMFLYSAPEIIDDAIKIQLGFMLHNGGKVVARDIFISIWVKSSPGQNCQIGFQSSNDPNWQGYWSLGVNYSTVSKPDLRVPPDSQVQPVTADLIFKPPFTKKLKIDITCGCDGGVLYKGTLENTPEKIQELYDEIFAKHKKRALTKDELHPYATKLMGRPEKN